MNSHDHVHHYSILEEGERREESVRACVSRPRHQSSMNALERIDFTYYMRRRRGKREDKRQEYLPIWSFDNNNLPDLIVASTTPLPPPSLSPQMVSAFVLLTKVFLLLLEGFRSWKGFDSARIGNPPQIHAPVSNKTVSRFFGNGSSSIGVSGSRACGSVFIRNSDVTGGGCSDMLQWTNLLEGVICLLQILPTNEQLLRYPRNYFLVLVVACFAW